MATITLNDIAHCYSGPSDNPEDYALKQLNLAWRDGGAYALLGPSGCGKTTMLNIISGLLTPSQRAGPVRRHGRDRPPPRKEEHRPGLPVPGHLRHHDRLGNLAFPLKNRGAESRDIDARVIGRWPTSST